jgi:8-oxo-dGTP pyrophosphatase MutT (NUDIX family)
MVGSSILPACFYKGQLYFLFGRENSLADTPGWSDFGGGVDKGESIYETALREGGEELTGFLGDGKQIERMIKKAGGVYKMQFETYHIHLFKLKYNEDLVKIYNDSHRFLWQRMSKKYLNNTKLFEKIEIKWFSLDEMKRRKHEFRNFYQKVIDETILKQEAQIRAFLGNGKSKGASRSASGSASRSANRSMRRGANKTQKKKKASTGWFF